MARHLGLHHISTAMPASGLGAAAAFLALCALALSLCASHSGRLRGALASVSRRRTDPAISIHQVQPGAAEVEPTCIWQKNILMGDKCQLPDFSGVINYDAAGNMVVPGRPGAVPALG